jgi:glycosyltransferase involved in cell wall biosynthesis
LRIGLEVRALHRSFHGSGQWRYARNLLHALGEQDSGHEYHLFAPYLQHELDFPSMPPGFRSTYSRLPVPPQSTRQWLWEQALFPIFLGAKRLAVCHFLLQTATWWAPCKVVVTAYDAMYDLFPEYSHIRGSRNYRLQKWAMRRADRLLAISRSTREDLVRSCQVDRNKVAVIPLAADPVFRPFQRPDEFDGARERYRLPNRFVLSVMSHEPRKNTLGIIRAFGQFVRRSGLPHYLVLFGDRGSGLAPGSVDRAVMEAGVAERVQFLGRVRDEELVALYNLADAFVFPSLYEGFGLPVVEALACGAAVVAANTSSMPEVMGDAGLLVNVASEHDLADAMVRIASDNDLRHLIQQRALIQARCFSWGKTARRVLDVYQDLSKS